MSAAPAGDPRIEHVFHAWDAALGARDLDASMALYRPDATLESPLICLLLGADEGVIRGRGALRPFVERVLASLPAERRRHRDGYLTAVADPGRVAWEYPRQRPGGEQLDIVEVMELDDDGLIAHHRVYWGWASFAAHRGGRAPAAT